MVYVNGFELNGLKTSIENMCSLRSCKILIENYFCISHKNKRKRNQEIKLLFNKIIYFLAHVRKLILLLINNIYGSIYPEMLLRKVVLKICRKCTGEHQCQSVISIKLLCDVIEIALWHGCSPVNLLHVFRTPFLKNTSGWLLLYTRLKKLLRVLNWILDPTLVRKYPIKRLVRSKEYVFPFKPFRFLVWRLRKLIDNRLL